MILKRAYDAGYDAALEKVSGRISSFGGTAAVAAEKATTPGMMKSVDNIKNLSTKSINKDLSLSTRGSAVATPPMPVGAPSI